MNLAKTLVSKMADEAVTLFADGKGAAEFTGFIDTGSYSLNAALSGSIFGGLADNKIGAFAGPESSGKTFLALALVHQFLKDNPDAAVAYYDTEAALTKDMVAARGIDTDRILLTEVDTVQDFSHRAMKLLDLYEKGRIEHEKKKKNEPYPRLMFVLDSLGMLSTRKEMDEIAKGSDTKDMTRAQLVKAAFRTLTLKCAKCNVPMLVTNHVYDPQAAYQAKQMSGGSGLKYAASSIAFFTKGKEKESIGGKDVVVGSVVNITMMKSRLSKEFTKVEALIRYDSGLDKFYGLFQLMKDLKLTKLKGKEWTWPDGSTVSGPDVEKNPEKYFTHEVLLALDEEVKKALRYGGGSEIVDEDEELEDYAAEPELLTE
jgi:RecA/RadA recombinase